MLCSALSSAWKPPKSSSALSSRAAGLRLGAASAKLNPTAWVVFFFLSAIIYTHRQTLDVTWHQRPLTRCFLFSSLWWIFSQLGGLLRLKVLDALTPERLVGILLFPLTVFVVVVLLPLLRVWPLLVLSADRLPGYNQQNAANALMYL